MPQAEWRGAHHLASLSIDTFDVMGYGQRAGIRRGRGLFFISRELPPATSLDQLSGLEDSAMRRVLLLRVADIVRRLHRSGANHRDLYLCHFWLADAGEDIENKPLYLIDLHRMQFRRRVPRRWLVKDLGGLYYSAMVCGLSRNDRLRFIRAYSGGDLKQADWRLWRSVERRARRMLRAGKEG